MNRRADQQGFSLIEVLVAITLFSIVSIAFYAAMFSGVRGSNTTRNVVRISEEARLGFNRMVRDTREAESFVSVGEDSYRIQTDFNRNGSFESPNGAGDFEDLTFTFDPDENVIRLSTPTLPSGEVLISGVEEVAGRDMFSFGSNLLEYDTVEKNPATGRQETRRIPQARADGPRHHGHAMPGPPDAHEDPGGPDS